MSDEQMNACEEFASSDEVLEGTIRGFDGEERTVQFSIVGNMSLFEGDILLNRPGLDPMGAVVSDPKLLWPNLQVPYVIADGLAEPERVHHSIAHWRARTPLTFVERDGHDDYIRFESAAGCSSNVGRIGGAQKISIGPYCSIGNVIHEIGHAVGLWHEQSREDRDQFVTVLWNNIQAYRHHNFDQHIADGDDVGPYDYGSIMHYPKTAFAIDPSRPTLKTPHGEEIGQRNALSVGDIGAVVKLYS